MMMMGMYYPGDEELLIIEYFNDQEEYSSKTLKFSKSPSDNDDLFLCLI